MEGREEKERGQNGSLKDVGSARPSLDTQLVFR